MSEDKDELASVTTLSSDNYPLGRILKKIESDVASLSSRSASSTSTRVGIASEKGIAAMGRLASGWVERVQRRVKLHKIDAYLKSHEDYIPPEYYEDLLELQRFECCCQVNCVSDSCDKTGQDSTQRGFVGKRGISS